jgi:hypothetical protein
VPNGAGHVPADEPEPAELVVWHEFLDQRKELSLLQPDVCVNQLPRRIQRLSIDAAGRHGDVEFASEPLELHVLDACLAEESRLRLHVPEQKREELFFLIPKVETLVVPEELHEFPGRGEPGRSIAVRGSTAQPHCLHEPIVMVARERDQGGVALHPTTLGYGVVPAVLAELTRLRHHPVPQHGTHVVNLVLARLTGVAVWRERDNRAAPRFNVSRRWGRTAISLPCSCRATSQRFTPITYRGRGGGHPARRSSEPRKRAETVSTAARARRPRVLHKLSRAKNRFDLEEDRISAPTG